MQQLDKVPLFTLKTFSSTQAKPPASASDWLAERKEPMIHIRQT